MEKRIGLGARSVVVWAPEGTCGRVPLVVMPVFRGDGSEVWRRCRELECPAFSLVSIGGVAWERDMTPWAAEPATRREAAYEGGAPAFLAELLDEVLPAAWPERAYLSLGSKEHKTPNRLMRNVRTATEQTRDLLCSHGVECTFELNPGNHFQDPDLRMARGIRWILD